MATHHDYQKVAGPTSQQPTTASKLQDLWPVSNRCNAKRNEDLRFSSGFLTQHIWMRFSPGFLRNSIYNSAKGGIMVQHATINNASLPKDNSNNKSRSLHDLRLNHSISNKAQAVHTRHKPGNGFQRSSDSTVLTTPNHTTGRQFLQEKVVQLHKTVRWYQR